MQQGGPYKIGQRFGPYTLEAYLGSGAFKSVYMARNGGALTGAEFVALGFPHQQDTEGIAELEKEFAATSRLDHPNIVRLNSIERHDGVSLLVMELLEGESLRDRLKREGKIDPAEAVRYSGLICAVTSCVT